MKIYSLTRHFCVICMGYILLQCLVTSCDESSKWDGPHDTVYTNFVDYDSRVFNMDASGEIKRMLSLPNIPYILTSEELIPVPEFFLTDDGVPVYFYDVENHEKQENDIYWGTDDLDKIWNTEKRVYVYEWLTMKPVNDDFQLTAAPNPSPLPRSIYIIFKPILSYDYKYYNNFIEIVQQGNDTSKE